MAAAAATAGDDYYEILAGDSDSEVAYTAQSGDGSDGDATFTVTMLEGDGYLIDADHASATLSSRTPTPCR